MNAVAEIQRKTALDSKYAKAPKSLAAVDLEVIIRLEEIGNGDDIVMYHDASSHAF